MERLANFSRFCRSVLPIKIRPYLNIESFKTEDVRSAHIITIVFKEGYTYDDVFKVINRFLDRDEYAVISVQMYSDQRKLKMVMI